MLGIALDEAVFNSVGATYFDVSLQIWLKYFAFVFVAKLVKRWLMSDNLYLWTGRIYAMDCGQDTRSVFFEHCWI